MTTSIEPHPPVDTLVTRGGDRETVISDEASAAMLHESLETLLRLLERVSPGMRASILLLDDDDVTMRHGAAPSLPAAYSRAIDGLHIGPEEGSCGTAAYLRTRVEVNDISTDPLWKKYKALAAQHGLAACWSTPIFDTMGRVLGTFAMYHDEPRAPTAADIQLTETATLLAKDIIKRGRAQAALRARTQAVDLLSVALTESEKRFRAMADAIPAQVWTARPDGKLNFVSKRTAAFFGVPASELIGTGWQNVVHPDDVERVAARWKHSLETGESYEIEFRVRAADGEYRWHLVRADAMRAADGKIVEWFGCSTDIEEQKRLEKALENAP